MTNTKLTVREIERPDIDDLCDYWYKASPEYMMAMGADINKLPPRSEFYAMVSKQIDTDYDQKMSYALIWQCDGIAVGHSNVNAIEYGVTAKMHLHLWNLKNRKQGLGTQLVKLSLPYFFKNLNLQYLVCEPYALNEAPNRTLEKAGFLFEKKYVTIPGIYNFEQEVNRWVMARERYEGLNTKI